MMGFSCLRCYSYIDFKLTPPLPSMISVSPTLFPLLTTPWFHSPFHSPGQYYFLLLRPLLLVPGKLPIKSQLAHFQATSFLLPGLLVYLLVDPHNPPPVTCSVPFSLQDLTHKISLKCLVDLPPPPTFTCPPQTLSPDLAILPSAMLYLISVPRRSNSAICWSLSDVLSFKSHKAKISLEIVLSY